MKEKTIDNWLKKPKMRCFQMHSYCKKHMVDELRFHNLLLIGAIMYNKSAADIEAIIDSSKKYPDHAKYNIFAHADHYNNAPVFVACRSGNDKIIRLLVRKIIEDPPIKIVFPHKLFSVLMRTVILSNLNCGNKSSCEFLLNNLVFRVYKPDAALTKLLGCDF